MKVRTLTALAGALVALAIIPGSASAYRYDVGSLGSSGDARVINLDKTRTYTIRVTNGGVQQARKDGAAGLSSDQVSVTIQPGWVVEVYQPQAALPTPLTAPTESFTVPNLTVGATLGGTSATGTGPAGWTAMVQRGPSCLTMLPELIDEGRRILVFSQFTTMLSLIAAELDRAKIGWVALTGDTRDRRVPVEDFQKGRVPVFLISLKAGGVGLNLTAADTVIHYDPWWNPAAENQATDRAHRIGQDKPVFVFKLVCAGSIEEKILALQEKKAALAESVLSEDADALAKFGEADIAALLAPLPAAGR